MLLPYWSPLWLSQMGCGWRMVHWWLRCSRLQVGWKCLCFFFFFLSSAVPVVLCGCRREDTRWGFWLIRTQDGENVQMLLKNWGEEQEGMMDWVLFLCLAFPPFFLKFSVIIQGTVWGFWKICSPHFFGLSQMNKMWTYLPCLKTEANIEVP